MTTYNIYIIEIFMVIGFIVGCFNGITAMKQSNTIIQHKSLLDYLLGK